jgi:hypothetical protein
VERVCSFLIGIMIAIQLILSVMIVVKEFSEYDPVDCSFDNRFSTQVIVTHAILCLALAFAMGLVLRIRWCSYEYSHINSTPVLIVLAAYMFSYFVRAVFLLEAEDFKEA